MSAKPLQLKPKTLTAIAEALFLAYTDDQAAYLAGISKATLVRIRQTPIWNEIERQRALFEKPYRVKVWQGQPGWQGAAWMLERQYPALFVKPEIQIAASTVNTTNQTLIITADVAKLLKSRSDPIDAEVEQLVAARSAASKAKASGGEAVNNGVYNTTDSSYASTVKEGEAYSPPRTPEVSESGGLPPVSGNSENPEVSSNYKKPKHKPQSSGKGKRARAQAMAGNRFAKVTKATKEGPKASAGADGRGGERVRANRRGKS